MTLITCGDSEGRRSGLELARLLGPIKVPPSAPGSHFPLLGKSHLKVRDQMRPQKNCLICCRKLCTSFSFLFPTHPDVVFFPSGEEPFID